LLEFKFFANNAVLLLVKFHCGSVFCFFVGCFTEIALKIKINPSTDIRKIIFKCSFSVKIPYFGQKLQIIKAKKITNPAQDPDKILKRSSGIPSRDPGKIPNVPKNRDSGSRENSVGIPIPSGP
jgi:hypothetical protein